MTRSCIIRTFPEDNFQVDDPGIRAHRALCRDSGWRKAFRIIDGTFEDEADCAKNPDVRKLWQLGICPYDIFAHLTYHLVCYLSLFRYPCLPTCMRRAIHQGRHTDI
jgi:hypothetical protein